MRHRITHGKKLNNSMLKHLYIKNFALIDELDIELHPGFSVMTGETGAGKSIILGAIGLLLGPRADSKSIKQGADKCVIEAHFDLSRYDMQDFFSENDIDYDENDCIVRRELTANGKSRAFINDVPVQLSMMRDLGDRLVDIHSQHQNLLINKQDFQLNVVDIIADDLTDEIREYVLTNIKGDSMVIAGDSGEDVNGEKAIIKLHYHTNEPWDVLSYCRTHGEIYDIVVEDMDRQQRGLMG